MNSTMPIPIIVGFIVQVMLIISAAGLYLSLSQNTSAVSIRPHIRASAEIYLIYSHMGLMRSIGIIQNCRRSFCKAFL